MNEDPQRRSRLDIRHVIIDAAGPHPSRANGLHNVARSLALEQDRDGDAAGIYFLRATNGESRDTSTEVPTAVLPLKGPAIHGKPLRLDPELSDLLMAGAGERTVFHVHGARQPILVKLARAWRKRGIPYVITIHGQYSHIYDRNNRPLKRLTALYLRHVEREALEGARFVQAISPAEREIVERVAPDANVQLIPNAGYSSRLTGVPPSPIRTSPSAHFPTFGFCGRYEIRHKGLDLLVEGFALYRRRGGTGRLVLIGSGRRDRIEALISRTGVEPAVEVHGPMFAEEKERAYREIDFFVLPSRFDVLPTACLEAAILGLPLSVSVETGLAEAVNEFQAGTVVRQLTPQAVADALLEAEGSGASAWPSMSAGSFSMGLSLGDWTSIARRIRDMYGAG